MAVGAGGLAIDYNGEGVLFVEADAPQRHRRRRDDFGPTAQAPHPTAVYTGDISPFSVLVLQVTYCKCGVEASPSFTMLRMTCSVCTLSTQAYYLSEKDVIGQDTQALPRSTFMGFFESDAGRMNRGNTRGQDSRGKPGRSAGPARLTSFPAVAHTVVRLR
ncbi:hypothetical protein U9M48_032296 [Paspalum notatum var. saurae]|uniref:Uncharacterized protein n=1 Tax=Paspalum notatum var. saurae TaxID=547442 RepID=A0AAQ3U711_PASNO